MSWRSARRVSSRPPTETLHRGSWFQVSPVFVPWLPLGFASVYLLWLVAQFQRIIDSVNLNPDAAWAPVLALDGKSGTKGGFILVGAANHVTTIWFLMATRSVAFRSVIWDWAPFLTFLAGLGLIAWACRAVAGRWAALLALSIGLAATPAVLLVVLPEGIHGLTFFADAILAAFLVFHACKWRGAAVATRTAASVLVVLVAGLTVASDPLFLVSGLLPFWAAATAVWITYRSRRNKRFALLVTVIAALALLVSVITGRVMHALGFRTTYATEGFALASRDQISRNIRIFMRHLWTLGNGSAPLGKDPSLTASWMRYLVIGAVAAGIGLMLWILLRRLVRGREPGWLEQPLALYLLFWVASGVAIFGAFALSTFAAGPSDTFTYAIPVFYALAATVPLLARRPGWARLPVTAGATLFCLLSFLHKGDVLLYERVAVFNPTNRVGSEVISFLTTQGVTRGYADYYNSHPLTLLSDGRIHSYPVLPCRQPVSRDLCPFPVNTRTAWYRPTSGARSFLLFDADAPTLISTLPPADFGAPAVTARFGGLSVFVYDYDVGSKLAPACPRGSASFFCAPKVQ